MLRSGGLRTYDIPFNRLPSIWIGIPIIWLEDPSILSLSSLDSQQTIDRLHIFDECHLVRYSNVSRCLKFLKRAQNLRDVIIIMVISNSSSSGKEKLICAINDIFRLQRNQQIQSILIIYINENDNNLQVDFMNEALKNAFKVVGVFYNHKSMLVRLQQLLDTVKKSDDGLFSIFNSRGKSLRDVRNELGPFVWYQNYRVILKAMPHNSLEAKREMIVESRAHYRNNQSYLKEITKFKKTYHSANAITWYTRDSFVYRLINRALRTEDIFALYKFRFFIVDMCANLENAATEFKKRTRSFRVYRGGKLSRDEVEKLRVDRLVSCNGFLSSTRDLNVALNYISIDPSIGISPSRSREDRQQFVLFEINVNFIDTPDIIVADASNQSVMPHEHEIIFNLGTTFIIDHITYDDKCHLWHIRMLSSSAVAELERGYIGIIRKRLLEISPTLLFGNLLATVSSAYRQGAEFFHRLLRSQSLEEKDRPNIYFNLGRVYRYMGKYEQANQYFRRAQQLQEERLPQSTFDYARTLADLGTVYSEMHQPAEAIPLITKAMSLHNEILSSDHVELAFNRNRLAYAYWQEKQYDRALNELFNSISSFKNMPTDHLGYAQALHTMGLVQYSLGNWTQALNDYKEALRMRESLLADDHPYVARTCYELSILYVNHINDYNMALGYAQRALKIRRAKLPPNHSEVKKSIELVEYLMQQDFVTAFQSTTL